MKFMEEKMIKNIERNNHLQHLVNVAPLITFAFGIQCWLISAFFPNQSLSHFAIPLALSLVLMMGGLVIYDTFSKFHMYETYLEIKSFIGFKRVIAYKDIVEVKIMDPEASFTNLVLKLNNNKYKLVYFIDDAVLIKEIITKYNKTDEESEPPEQMAA